MSDYRTSPVLAPLPGTQIWGQRPSGELGRHPHPVPTPSHSPQEYEPTIFYPTRSLDPLHRDLTIQCEKMDIPFLSYLPTEVSLGGT